MLRGRMIGKGEGWNEELERIKDVEIWDTSMSVTSAYARHKDGNATEDTKNPSEALTALSIGGVAER